MSFEFAWPWLLITLPLPLLVALSLPRAQISLPATLRVPFYGALQQSLAKPARRQSRARLLLAVLAWLLLVMAAARPQWIGETLHLPVSGRSLMLAVDISGSMQNEDMQIEDQQVMRLTAVKHVAADFIGQRTGDQLGLILFGDQAYMQVPLTFDRSTVQTLLNEAAIGLAGKRTAIGDAIGLAIKRLREQAQQNRVLILLTDGTNTAGSIEPLKAADLAASEAVRIYTIGIGADSMLVRGPFGIQRVASGDLDEDTLQAIADKTGGRYFRARDTESLQEIYALLDAIEPASEDDQSYRPVDELYAWPLGGALLISLLLALPAGGWIRRGLKSEARHA